MIKKVLPILNGYGKGIALTLFAFFSMTVVAQQNLTVKGKVTTTSGSAVSNASVREKNTTNGTTTDADGNFSISVSSNATLIFSYVGLAEREVPVNGSSSMSITLDGANSDLDQVIVVGYGSRRKRDITSAVSTININEVGDMPSRNPTQLIQGQASGVVVKQKDGRPGAEMEVRIRGIGSIGANSEPLYVIDGLPVGTQLGANYNPNDIESITVLKDAASTAIYGARGSNGVVLITTKSAKEGQLNLSLTLDYGIQNIPDSRKVKMLNGVEFAQFLKDVWMDKVRYFQNREPSIDEVPEGFRHPEQTRYSTNWFDEILNNNAPYSDVNLTFSSGKGAVARLKKNKNTRRISSLYEHSWCAGKGEPNY